MHDINAEHGRLHFVSGHKRELLSPLASASGKLIKTVLSNVCSVLVVMNDWKCTLYII